VTKIRESIHSMFLHRKFFVPQVIKSAQVMKKAVAYFFLIEKEKREKMITAGLNPDDICS
jgi:cobalamin-dependent methionine synthase I